MRGRNWNVLALLTVVAMGLGACGGDGGTEDLPDTQPPATDAAAAGDQQVTLAEGVTQEQFDEGRQLFTGQGGCHACHGQQATGTQLAPNLTDGEWLNVSGPVVSEIAQLIQTGVPQPVEHPAPMPPMGGANLTEAQVQALAAYVASIGQG
jgi:mono/diheme cytochrome c family protein